jgi:thioredoxin 1
MALRIPTISSSHGLASSPAPISTTCRPAVLAVGSSWASASAAAAQKRSLLLATTASETRGVAPVRSSGIETTTSVGAAEAVTGQVTEVNKDTFWPIVEAAGDKVVVLDMYTEWYLQFFFTTIRIRI